MNFIGVKSEEDVRSVIVTELARIGVNFQSDEWVFDRSGFKSVADDDIKFKWKDILKGFDAAEATEGFGVLLKKIAACYLLGLNSRACSPVTVKMKTIWARRFLQYLSDAGYKKLSLLSAAKVRDLFSEYHRNKYSGKNNSASTVTDRMNVVSQMYRMRGVIGDCFLEDPFPQRYRKKILKDLGQSRAWEAPPEPVCIYLLQLAMKFVDLMSEQLVDKFLTYTQAVEDAKLQGAVTKKRISAIANPFLLEDNFNPSVELDFLLEGINTGKPSDLAFLLNQLQTACFILISYTTGPRVSEIRRASTSSLKYVPHLKGGSFPYYFAARSKRRFSSGSNTSLSNSVDDSPWVLSPAAVKAFEVLKKLSSPARKISGKDNLWLVTAGNALWPFNAKKGYSVISAGAINLRLNTFAKFIKLQASTGWTGKLHSHMGRKHFARFIAKRDRTVLGDLALQYSHTTAYSVDVSYAQPDAEFRRILKEELSSEMESVAVELAGLTSEKIYNNTGGQFESRTLGKFVGQLRSMREIRVLLSRGTILVPCQWGVCMYRQETSACRGSKREPNPDNRSPQICHSCANFFATPKHRLWWENYRADSERLLVQTNLPEQTRIILTSRLKDAEEILKVI